MRLTDLLTPLQRKPAIAGAGAIAGLTLRRSGPLRRSTLRGGPALERLPDPPPLEAPRDMGAMRREASFARTAARYNPHRMTGSDLQEMAHELRRAGAIGAADYALLLRGPEGGYRTGDPETPHDLIADWQLSLARGMGRPDLRAVGAGTRALNILGRIAAARAAA
jgi:hypothetical protein